MSAAAADAVEVTSKKGSKKLILLIALIAVLVLCAGAGVLVYMKKKAAAAEEDDDSDEPARTQQVARHDPGHVPTFLPLDTFTVNLADRDAERYAQVGITLQVDDPKVAEELKAYMPAIRNGVLMVLAHKTSAELLERAGKEKLAEEIMREAVRPLGIEIEDESRKAESKKPESKDSDDDEDETKPKKKRKKKPAVHNPVEHVHFSSFIIQ